MEPLIGLEPMTLALQIQCSTNWAKEAYGPNWIWTSVGINQQIYSLPPLGGQREVAVQNWTWYLHIIQLLRNQILDIFLAYLYQV